MGLSSASKVPMHVKVKHDVARIVQGMEGCSSPELWVRRLHSALKARYPRNHVMVCDRASCPQAQFVPGTYVHTVATFQGNYAQHTYFVWVFKEGSFVLEGEAGPENWKFDGGRRFGKQGKTVRWYKWNGQ
jgi:hypothetical protein